MADMKKIIDSRKAERAATGEQFKTAMELRFIADTLEAIRIDLAGLIAIQGRQSGMRQ